MMANLAFNFFYLESRFVSWGPESILVDTGYCVEGNYDDDNDDMMMMMMIKMMEMMMMMMMVMMMMMMMMMMMG